MNDCIEWSGHRHENGYGIRWDHARKVQRRAHRMAWEEVHGSIPADLCVLHRCDNPPCINVEHLFLGTRGDNNRDRHAKGRTGRGTAVLFKTDIPTIRERLANGEYHKDIAASYGVSPSTIGMIACGKSWTHVQEPKQSSNSRSKQS